MSRAIPGKRWPALIKGSLPLEQSIEETRGQREQLLDLPLFKEQDRDDLLQCNDVDQRHQGETHAIHSRDKKAISR